MAIVNTKYKFIFLFEPHTASRSTRTALKTLEGSKEIGDHHITIHKMNRRNMLSKREKDYPTISAIRNPFDHIVTHYFCSDGGRRTFKEWVSGYLNNYSEIFRHADSDYFIRYEALPDSLNGILKEMNAPEVELPYIGKTKHKPDWKSMYSDEVRRLVEINLTNMYGYGFDNDYWEVSYGRHTNRN